MGRLSDEIAKIMSALKAISCEVCKASMGYVEGDDAPAAYCSDKCVKAQARQNAS